MLILHVLSSLTLMLCFGDPMTVSQALNELETSIKSASDSQSEKNKEILRKISELKDQESLVPTTDVQRWMQLRLSDLQVALARQLEWQNRRAGIRKRTFAILRERSVNNFASLFDAANGLEEKIEIHNARILFEESLLYSMSVEGFDLQSRMKTSMSIDLDSVIKENNAAQIEFTENDWNHFAEKVLEWNQTKNDYRGMRLISIKASALRELAGLGAELRDVKAALKKAEFEFQVLNTLYSLLEKKLGSAFPVRDRR